MANDLLNLKILDNKLLDLLHKAHILVGTTQEENKGNYLNTDFSFFQKKNYILNVFLIIL